MQSAQPERARVEGATILLGCLIAWMSLPEGSTAIWSSNLLYALDLVVAGFVALTVRRRPGRRIWPLHAGFGFPAVVVSLSLWRGDSAYPQISVDSLAEVVGAWALCWAVWVVAAAPAAARQIVMCVLSVCVAQATFGAMMVLTGVEYGIFGPKTDFIGAATGTFVNRNHLAAFLAVGAALGIGWLVGHMRRATRSWREFGRGALDATLGEKGRLRLALVVLVIGIVMSRSRMGNVAFVVALSAAASIYLVAQRFSVSRTFVALLISFALIDAVLVGSFFGLDRVAERLEQTSLASEQRDEVLRDGTRLVTERPWMGWGAGTFRYVYPAVRGDDIVTSTSAAHNDYLEALVEIGGLGMAAYVWLGGMLAYAGWRAMRGRDAQARALGFAAWMALIYTAVHATVEFNGQIPAFTHLLAIVLGLAWAASTALPAVAGSMSRETSSRIEG